MNRCAAAALLSLSLSACVAFQPGEKPPLYASKELFAACEVADAATTWYAVHILGAVELNPAGLALIGGLKVLVVWMRYDKDEQINQEGGGVLLNAIACVPPVLNLRTIVELRKAR